MRFLSKKSESSQTAIAAPRTGNNADLNSLCRTIRILRAQLADLESKVSTLRRDFNRLDRSQYRAAEAETRGILEKVSKGQAIGADFDMPPLPNLY